MPGEEPMHVGASKIALANPRLKSFSISFIPAHGGSEDLPPPLERGVFELTCDAHGIPVCLDVSQRYTALWPWQRHVGVGASLGAGASAGLAEWFAAVASALGVEGPMLLLENSFGASAGSSVGTGLGGVSGSFGKNFGFFRGRSTTTRRWRCDLRPSGHPDAARKGAVELLTERSPAGEEARMMMICLCLLLLTLWALVSKATLY